MNVREVHTGHGWLARWRAGLADDSGSETIAMAVLFPIVLVMLLTIVQAGLWWHAQDVCSTAAQEGVDAGRTVTGTPASAQAAATSFVDRAGAGLLSNPDVSASADAQTMRISVSADVVRVLPIPGLNVRAQATAQAAKEQFTVPGGRP